jgi:diacylglycerol kinase (ATP)
MNPGGEVVCIVNPTSGGGKGARMADVVGRLLPERGLRPVVRLTDQAGHAVDLARQAACQGARLVVAVGGDGTIHETANGLLQALEADPTLPAVLGLVPVGTGNDFVKVIGGTADRGEALDTLVTGSVHRFDAGHASWEGGAEFFVNAAGTGIDVEVVRVMDPGRSGTGALVYVKALARALRRYRPIAVQLDVDGRKSEDRVMMIAIANGQSVGGMFRICPQARPDDGLLDVCAVREMALFGSILTAARIVRGTHSKLGSVRMERGKRIELTVPGGTPLFFQLDGELREPGGARVLTIEVRPGALPVMTAVRADVE